MCNTRHRQVISKKNKQSRHGIFISYFFLFQAGFCELEGAWGRGLEVFICSCLARKTTTTLVPIHYPSSMNYTQPHVWI